VQVRSLHIYPVKSSAGLPLDEAQVQPWGLAGDRRWAVVDQAGAKVVAWRHRRLLWLTGRPTETGLLLTAPGRPALEVPFPDPRNRTPVPHSRLATAVPASNQAAQWLTELLDHPVRLVWLDDPELRPMSEQHGGRPGEPLSLADAAPLLLTSVASLDELDRWVADRAADEGEAQPKPLAMTRFRPNVVIDGQLPFAEDGWQTLRIGEVSFRQAELCDRCVLTTIDPEQLTGGKEPIRTLARHRRWKGKTWFGIRLVPQSTGRLRVGDRIELGSDVR
jgi:hypothetical protein